MPSVVAEAPDDEAKPLELVDRGLRLRGPDELAHDRAALGALDGEVVQLIGRGLDVGLEAEAVGEVLQPDAVVGVAADEAEVVVAQAEDGGVVDHAAGLVADRGVDDVADGQAAGVAGDRVLDERLGVGSEDLPLAQGGEVHDDGLLAAGPVLGDGALVVVAVGQPVPAVLHEALGQRARARMERRLLGQHGLCLRGDAVGDRHREAVLGGVDAHVDVGELPAVRRVDVVRARRRGAHQIGHRAQQHVVAGARPGLVEAQDVARVEDGVVEEVERLPSLALGDPVGRDLAVEVLRAADVPGIAHVLVVLGRAGEREGVVAPDGVAHDLHERIHVDVVELALQARGRVRVAHQRSRGHAVEAALDAALELGAVEGEEVRALPALDVDDLDVLALAHLVGQGAGEVDSEVQARLGQRGAAARARRPAAGRRGGSRRRAPRPADRRRRGGRPERPR